MKKRVVLTVIIVLVFGGLLCLQPERSMAANQTGVVTATSLNVRTGAGTTYAVLQYNGAEVKLSNGTKVSIAETLPGWYKVNFTYQGAALSGYVSSSYIAIETAATATPTPTPVATSVTYRTETTYKAICVPAKLTKASSLYKSNGKKRYTISKRAITLSKGKSVKILGEKVIKGKKWFKISFTYKKKTRKAYVRNTYVKMTLKTSANARIANVKKIARVHTKKGTTAPYKKSGGKAVSLTKGTTVSITKDVILKKTRWYKLSFTYNGKKLTGYVNSKYVKLTKKAVTKKVPVIALSDAEFEQAMKNEGFPESYKQSLRVLHSAYPYWQFKAYKTGLDWNTAVNAESKTGVSLISNSRGKAWKSTAADAYDASTGKWKVFDGSTWVAASRAAVAYYMDPRNFLNDRSVYMFEMLEYQPQYQTKAGVNTILSNTPFYNKTFKYKDLTTGASKTMYYVDAFMEAAKNSKASPYHLASRVKQEVVTSATTTSSAVSGTVSSYPGIYNFYNIGATSSSTPVLNGLKWASDTKAGTYLRPWTDPYRSIVGGAQYISSGYIAKGQNTCYLEKFNVTTYKRYEHQYMTNVEAAYEEAIKTKKAYAGMMDKSPLVFSIPVFENMPANNSPMPG
ncbi:MAG: SH3 domain-containing protein [Eubacterium sp.]|nr:SH3 domain-containing protein [Eubacterium sp.]